MAARTALSTTTLVRPCRSQMDLFSALGGNEAATDMLRLILGHLDFTSLRLVKAVGHQYWSLVRECIQRSDWRHRRSNFEELSMAMWAEGTFRPAMLVGHEDAVCSLAFQGSLLASGSRDGTARLWSVSDTAGAPEAVLKHVLAHPNLVTCVALNSDGSLLSSGCYDQQIRLWCTESGECTRVLSGHSGTVWAAQWAGPRLLSGAGYPECCVSLWDPKHGRRLASSKGHTKAVRALATGQDALQGVLVSGSYDLSVRLWDESTLRCVGTRLGHAREVFSVAAGSERIASGSVDRTICLWDRRAPGSTATLSHGGGGHQWSLAMLGEHGLFAGSGDGAVRIWDLRRMPAGETAAASDGSAASGASHGLVACMSAESGGQQHKAGSCALALDRESGRRMASGGPSICVRQLP